MLNRSIAPEFSKNFSFELPPVDVLPLANGTDLIVLQGLQQEIIKLEFIFKAGKWYEPKVGLSHFTAIMLDKGSIKRSAIEISGLLDYYGSQIEITPGYDFTTVALYVLKKYLFDVMPVFLEVITSPNFPTDELSLQKEIFIQNLRISNQKNSTIASKLLRKNIFGPHHPYGSSADEANVSSLAPEDLVGFYKTNFAPIEIYLIGNLNFADIDKLSEQFSVVGSRSVNDVSFTLQGGSTSQYEPRPESVQSAIRLGKQIINRGHADYFPLLLVNHILGGYFGSRLMKNIREEKGLTYGIYSSLHPFKNSCMFSIGADVNKENKEIVFQEIKKELATLRSTLIHEEELVVSKNHFLGSLQLEVANPFSSFDKVKNIRLNQLNKDYYTLLFESIQSVNSARLIQIAQTYFTEESFHDVSVG